MATRLMLCLCAILLLSDPAAAQSAADKGLAIAQEADARDRGWQDQTARLEMILRNRQGQESRRRLRISTLEMTGDGDRSLIVFESPRDISGTALLSYTHALVPDDQWLFLPALKRVKRIASANKSGPFVGSEFAYEDLASAEVEKYRYTWLRDEPVQGRDAFVIEQHPAYVRSGYTRRVVWLDKAWYQPLKVEFYDRRNALLKTLTVEGYAQYADRYWRPAKMRMVNHQTAKSTELTWIDYRFGNGLSDRDFDRNTLQRAR